MFFRPAGRRRRVADAPCRAELHGEVGRAVLTLETGVGPAAAEAALDWLLGCSSPRPSVVLSAGFSGALRPGLGGGDLLLAEAVCDADGCEWPTTWAAGPLPLRPGRLLTTRALVGDPVEKRRLGERYRADAVDMEAAVIARRCDGAGVPFGCVRVISDDVDTALSPALLDVLRGGRVGPGRLLAAVLRRPRLVGELWRLGAHTRRAARALGAALNELLRGIERR
jgi:adenosylhomocysteine nucleosidase